MGKTRDFRQYAKGHRKHPHERGEDHRGTLLHTTRKETPPRAWGRLAGINHTASPFRNTPTSVGKTNGTTWAPIPFLKHPHERGEDRRHLRHAGRDEETPPRAWGRLLIKKGIPLLLRNTPTSVGKTSRWCSICPGVQKHPHERGEDQLLFQILVTITETPPRAWGRLPLRLAHILISGNTPTSVGKTPYNWSATLPWQKHPHERGEDGAGLRAGDERSETPPRAWGRLFTCVYAVSLSGNTPTSVGKTMNADLHMSEDLKHPHERGEDKSVAAASRAGSETPPRAWGRRKYSLGRTGEE